MITTTQIIQAICAVSKRVTETEKRMDEYFGKKNEQQVANLDYLSMMSGINIPSEEE